MNIPWDMASLTPTSASFYGPLLRLLGICASVHKGSADSVSRGYSIEERALGSKARQHAQVPAISERKMRKIETEDKPVLV